MHHTESGARLWATTTNTGVSGAQKPGWFDARATARHTQRQQRRPHHRHRARLSSQEGAVRRRLPAASLYGSECHGPRPPPSARCFLYRRCSADRVSRGALSTRPSVAFSLPLCGRRPSSSSRKEEGRLSLSTFPSPRRNWAGKPEIAAGATRNVPDKPLNAAT